MKKGVKRQDLLDVLTGPAKPKKKVVTLSLDAGKYEALKDICEKKGENISAVVDVLIGDLLKEIGQKNRK